MTGLLSTVRSQVAQSCIVNRCSKDRCSVSLRGVSHDRLVIDCDLPGSPFSPNQAKCDYLLFEEPQNGAGRAIPIELKSGRIRAREAIAQLQVGATAVEDMIPARIDVEMLPLLAYGNIPKGERAAIENGRVQFRGKATRIKRIRCGNDLPQR